MHSAERATRFEVSRRDGGLTFIEVLVSIVLLGTTVIAVLVGLTTTIIGADEHRDQSTGIALVVDGLESVKRAPFSCGPYDPTVGVDVPSGWSVSVAALESSVDGDSWVSPCDSLHPLQRITIVASNGESALDGEVIKRAGAP